MRCRARKYDGRNGRDEASDECIEGSQGLLWPRPLYDVSVTMAILMCLLLVESINRVPALAPTLCC